MSNYMNIEHISVSRKTIWEECPQKYKYRYHLEVIPDIPTPFHFTYGKIIHKIAEEFVTLKGVRQLGEIATDVLNGVIPYEEGEVAPKLPTSYQRRMPGHLRAIQSLTDRIGTEGIVEHHFLYDLDPPNGRNIKGFIDRIINVKDKWFIIDYKTTKRGKWRKTPRNIMHDLQLRAYARVVQREFGAKPENIRAALYYLEGANLIATDGYTEQSLEAAEKELLNAYQQIEQTNPDHVTGKVGFWCGNCDYRNKCPYYRAANADESLLPENLR